MTHKVAFVLISDVLIKAVSSIVPKEFVKWIYTVNRWICKVQMEKKITVHITHYN